MKNIAIIFGGKSVEHDISVITALQVMKNLKGYKLYPIYIKPDGTFVTADNLTKAQTYLNYETNVLKEKPVVFEMGKQNLLILKNNKIRERVKIDCALLCNHGHGGEDGSLQGLLENAEIPYTSSDVAASALSMSKILTKIILLNEHIDTPAYFHFNNEEYVKDKDKILKQIKKEISLPCIIKPEKLGSSVGISICEDAHMLSENIEEAFIYDDNIIVEKYVKNAREFCCAVIKIGDRLFPSNVQEVHKEKLYTFEEKYIANKERVKTEISDNLCERIKKLAMCSYKALNCFGVSRVDFLYDEKEDKLYVNEINNIPGSLAFNLFSTSFSDLIDSLIEEGEIRNKQKNNICYEFNSEAIKNFISLSETSKTK